MTNRSASTDRDLAPDAARTTLPRRSERVSLGAEIELRRTGTIKHHVTVRDCSPEGCCINLVDRIGLDEVIWVKLPGLESLEAYVCWTKGFVAGLEFAKPLHPAVFQMLLQRHGGE